MKILKVAYPNQVIRILCYTIVGLCACACTEKAGELTDHLPYAPPPNISTATLRSMYTGKPFEIAGADPSISIVLSGYVTSSDRQGNFHRSVVIQDNSGAAEILVGGYDLHNRYGLGQRVTVTANSLQATIKEGMLQIGLASSSPKYELEYMDHRWICDRYLLCSNTYTDVQSLTVRASVLQDHLIGTLIRINNLRLEPDRDTTWAITAALSANGKPKDILLKFRNSPTDSIFIETSGYAQFAAERVPRHISSVTGILHGGTKEKKRYYYLKIRDLSDVKTD